MVRRLFFGLRFDAGVVAFTSICGSSTTVITALSTSGNKVVEVAVSFSIWRVINCSDLINMIQFLQCTNTNSFQFIVAEEH